MIFITQRYRGHVINMVTRWIYIFRVVSKSGNKIKPTLELHSTDIVIDYIHVPIIDTHFQQCVFWPPDTELRIKLTFSESVSLSLKTR